MSSRGHNQAGRVSVFDPAINPTHPTNMWATCPLGEYQHDPSIGVYLHEPWSRYEASGAPYTVTQSGAVGTAAISTAASGVLEVDSGSTTVVQGANLQHDQAGFVPVAGTELWFETLIKIVDTYDKCELFVGLSETDTAIIDTSSNASESHIGWQCVTDDGVLLFTSEKATAGDTSAAVTIEEATYVKLGFHVIGITSVQQYVNGVAVGTAHATANVPIVAVYPSFVCQSGGTNDPIMHVRPYTVFQTHP